MTNYDFLQEIKSLIEDATKGGHHAMAHKLTDILKTLEVEHFERMLNDAWVDSNSIYQTSTALNLRAYRRMPAPLKKDAAFG